MKPRSGISGERLAPPKAATPVAFVNAVLLGYERYGLDPHHALQSARIPLQLLGDPNACITAGQMEVLCSAAMQELDDEALGWFSRKLPWGSYGLLCRASLSSPSLGIALKRWCRHHRLLTDDLLLSLRIAGSQAILSLEEKRSMGPMREFCLVTSLRNVHGYASWAVDSRIALGAVSFPYPAPIHAGVYPLIFPGEVLFDSHRAEMRFDARYLSLALRRDEAALNSMLERALPLTLKAYRRDRLLKQRVRSSLSAEPGAFRNADILAASLGVSTRTLHRQLREEGTSLQVLRDSLRCEQAMGLLSRTRKPVKQIATAVGFKSDKSFSRAFRSWTGTTPEQTRDRSDLSVEPSNAARDA